MEEEIKVSQLPAATQINNEDLLMIIQNNTNKKVSASEISNIPDVNNHSVVVSATEPQGNDRRKVWLRHSSNLLKFTVNLDSYTTAEKISDSEIIITSTNPNPIQPTTTLLTGELDADTYTIKNYSSKRLYIQTSTGDYSNYIDTNQSYTFTYDGISYLRLVFATQSQNETVNYKAQLEKGEVATTYEAYSEGDKTYILKDNVYKEYNDSNVIVSPTEPSTDRRKVWLQNGYIPFDGEIEKTGYILNSDGTETANEGCYITQYVKVKPNTTYTLKYTSTYAQSGMRIGEYTTNKTFIQRLVTSETTYIFTTTSTTEYIKFSAFTSYTNANSIKIKVEDKEYILNNDVYEEFEPQNELVLWENSSPTSDFAGQTINLKTDNYSYYEIIWRLVKNSNQYKNTGKTTKSTYAYLDYVGGAGTLLGFKRDITAVTDTSITFADAYRINTNEVENGRCIPVKVIGYR